jgi:hypothetical protein
MSRKFNLALALATASVIAAASFGSTSADARSFSIRGKSTSINTSSLTARSGNEKGGRNGGTNGGRLGLGDEKGGRNGGDKGGYRGGDNGGRLIPIGDRPGRPDHPEHPGHPGFFHDHGRWVFRDGRWIIVDAPIGEAPVVEPAIADGPCTCLTKTYTPDGLVVFADICTKEAASAAVAGSAPAVNRAPVAPRSPVTPVPPADEKSSDATQAPTSPNYAGLTYQDYLAMNAQGQKN